jgi:hypothetical protein
MLSTVMAFLTLLVEVELSMRLGWNLTMMEAEMQKWKNENMKVV